MLSSAACQPDPCSEEQRRPVRASRTVVRPGMKNGGTTLIFRLSRPAVLRITIVRVYPSCKRLGSFTVRAHAGVNRVRFRGRFRGRALPAGGYRLVVRARGAERDVAAIPIVIARGKTSPAALSRARHGSTCSEPIADLGAVSTPGGDQPGSNGGRLEAVEKPVVGVAGAVAGATKTVLDGVGDRVTRAIEDSPLDDPFVLTIIGLLLLVIAFLGTLLLAQVVRSLGVERDPDRFA